MLLQGEAMSSKPTIKLEPLEAHNLAQERLRRLAEIGAEKETAAAPPPSRERPPPPPAADEAEATAHRPRETAASEAASRDIEELKYQLHGKLVEQLRPEIINTIPESRRRGELRKIVEPFVDAEAPLLNLPKRRQLIEELLDETLGFGPLEQLLKDPSISDILVNGANEVWVERHGNLEKSDIRFRNNQHLLQVIDRIVSKVGRRVDEMSPMVDARLSDGSRVNAIIPPLALRGPALSIRRFGARPIRLTDLLQLKCMTPEMARFLESAVKGRLNILISGGTGTGKTTLLNTLSAFISPSERLVTIEDAAELQLQQPHVVQLETRPPNVEGKGEIAVGDLIRNALRMRPDRMIIGECRGGEVLQMLQAMNSGHEGSMTTMHANNPRDALGRIEIMTMLSGIEIPVKAIRQQIAASLNLILQLERLQGGTRRITSITELAGLEGDVVMTQELFRYRQLGVDHQARAHGVFESTGVRPNCEKRLRSLGLALPPEMFQERELARA